VPEALQATPEVSKEKEILKTDVKTSGELLLLEGEIKQQEVGKAELLSAVQIDEIKKFIDDNNDYLNEYTITAKADGKTYIKGGPQSIQEVKTNDALLSILAQK